MTRPSILDELSLDRHGVIEASAGTGKTYTLEHLVVEIVLRGVPLERILVVTFTDKATQEMRRRLRDTLHRLLREFARGPSAEDAREIWNAPPNASDLLRDALISFDRAPIQTIHGFCQKILSEHAFANSRSFRVELVDSRRAFGRALREETRVLLAERSVASALLELMMSTLSYDRMEDVLYRWFVELGRPMPRWDAEAFRRAIGEWSSPEHQRAIERLGPPVDPSIQETLRRHLGALGDIANAFGKDGDEVRALLALERWRNEKIGSRRLDSWCLGAFQGGSSEDAASERNALIRRLQDFLSAPSPMSVAVQEIVPRVERRLRASKRRSGQIDFDDMLRETHRMLTGGMGRAVRDALQQTYQYGLVDEFQDTDDVQWAIFRSIFVDSCRDNVLYVIGDPKQAIYGFRNADLFTYRQACDEILHGREPHLLRDNYRSTASLIDATHQIFTNGFFQADSLYREKVRCGRPGFRAVDACGHDVAPVVLLQAVDSRPIRAARLRAGLGSYIAVEIKRLVDEQALRLQEGDHERALEFSDIYVLTRTNAEATAIGAQLERHGIPHAFFKQEGLFETREASDIVDVLRAVANPSNHSARLKAWLTPFFAMPLQALEACRDVDEHHPLLARLYRWKALADAHNYTVLFRALMEDSGLVRRALFLQQNERLLTNYHHVLEILLAQSHGRRCDVDTLIELLEAFRAKRALPPGEQGDLQRLPSEQNAVQMLTMHKAKGLEAAVVFVAGGFGLAPTQPHEPRVCHPQGVREAWHGSLPLDIEKRVREEQRSEDERLLYVTLTRAQARLYLPYFGPAPSGSHESLAAKPHRYKRLNGPYRIVDQALRTIVAREPNAKSESNERSLFEYRAFDIGSRPAAAERISEPKRNFIPDRPSVDHASEFTALRHRHAGWTLTSYTRLKSQADAQGDVASEKEEFFSETYAEPNESSEELPGGAAMGIFLHELLERVDFLKLRRCASVDAWVADPVVAKLARECGSRAGIASRFWDAATALTFRCLKRPVALESLTLSNGLCAVQNSVAEMSFHFPIPEPEHPVLAERRHARGPEPAFRIVRGAIQGVIDLVFTHCERTFVVDWKSDRLDNYSRSTLQRHASEHYELQKRLYTLAAIRMMNVRDKTDHEQRFGGLIFAFLRGLGALDGHEDGLLLAKPSWEEISAWEEELRTSNEPFGYPLFRRKYGLQTV